jgi:hypothetical protein
MTYEATISSKGNSKILLIYAFFCAGYVRQMKGEEDAIFYITKDRIFFPLFLSNEPAAARE